MEFPANEPQFLSSVSTGNLEGFAASPMGDMAFQVGANIVGEKLGRVNGLIEAYAGFLKYYFDVTTHYVTKKIFIVLFPFLKKNKLDWKRSADYNGYLSARDDVNAPDLYLPLMSFLTFVILIAFVEGSTSTFTPEVLGSTATTLLICIILEATILKFGYYLFGSYETLSFADFVSYSGYVFIPATFNTVIGMIFGTSIYYITLFVTATSMFLFMLRTLVHSLTGGAFAQSDPRTIFLLSFAAFQYIMILFLGHQAKWDSNFSLYQVLFSSSDPSIEFGELPPLINVTAN